MNTTTVKFYFRNIMCFVHHDTGTDVWFFSNHAPKVFTRTRVEPLTGLVVSLVSQGQPIPGNVRTTVRFPLVISMNTLAPGVGASTAIKNRELTDKLVARLELPGAGTLSDLASGHSLGVLLDWKTPVAGGGRPPHIQRLTEVATYTLENVTQPVELHLSPASGPKTIIPLEPNRDGVAEAFFLAGELPKQMSAPSSAGQKIDEFRAIHDCLDERARGALAYVIPEADLPTDRAYRLSADPFCPCAQFSLPKQSEQQ